MWRTAKRTVVWSVLALTGCAVVDAPRTPEPHIAAAVPYTALAGWQADAFDGVLDAVLAQCAAPSTAGTGSLCAVAQTGLPIALRDHLMQHYRPHAVLGDAGAEDGLITGYYEPLLHGSVAPNARYRWPLYRRPRDLVTLDLAERYPELEGRRVRGRLVEQRVVPYWTRADIDGPEQPLAGDELLWVDDPVDAFFLHVQGSGLVALADGRVESVGYSDQNGHPYRSIGRVLVDLDEVALEDVSLFSIRAWLADNPDAAQALLNENPSYVFFERRGDRGDDGPLGTLGVPLTAERSIAVDPRVIPLGSLVWLDTTLDDGQPYRRLMVAQDTGGAIAGGPRADVFFGRGERAERLAGTQKSRGRLYVFRPVESDGGG
ncbi:MAG: MltA domain-containing protein [Pseudomonadota bacterium]